MLKCNVLNFFPAPSDSGCARIWTRVTPWLCAWWGGWRTGGPRGAGTTHRNQWGRCYLWCESLRQLVQWTLLISEIIYSQKVPKQREIFSFLFIPTSRYHQPKKTSGRPGRLSTPYDRTLMGCGHCASTLRNQLSSLLQKMPHSSSGTFRRLFLLRSELSCCSPWLQYAWWKLYVNIFTCNFPKVALYFKPQNNV